MPSTPKRDVEEFDGGILVFGAEVDPKDIENILNSISSS